VKIIDFIKRQITIKNWGDACLLILKMLFVVFVINEIYDEIQYINYFFKLEKLNSNIMIMLVKRLFFVLIICGMLPYLWCLKKRGWSYLCIITIITLGINGSILGIFFIDGPYWGRVVDAETSKPLSGVHVVGKWGLESWYLFGWVGDREDVRETITDKNGVFFLPIGRTVMFYPISRLELKDIYVYKPGYDSHPPRIQYCWTEKDEKKWGLTKYQYRRKYEVFGRKFMSNTIRLNEASSYLEQREAIRLDFNISGDIGNRAIRHRIKKMINLYDKEKRRLRRTGKKLVKREA